MDTWKKMPSLCDIVSQLQTERRISKLCLMMSVIADRMAGTKWFRRRQRKDLEIRISLKTMLLYHSHTKFPCWSSSIGSSVISYVSVLEYMFRVCFFFLEGRAMAGDRSLFALFLLCVCVYGWMDGWIYPCEFRFRHTREWHPLFSDIRYVHKNDWSAYRKEYTTGPKTKAKIKSSPLKWQLRYRHQWHPVSS